MCLRLLFDKISAPAIWRIHICYLPAGRSVLGKTVPEVLRPKAQFFPIRTNLKKKTTGKDAKAGKLVAVRTQGLDGKIRTAGARAISQSDSRI